MGVSVQESLLDVCEEPSLGALGGSVRRTPLAHGAWVDLRRGWLTGSGAVFGRLVQTVPWRAEKRQMYDKVVAVPRLLCFYGEDAPLPDPVLTAARQALDGHYDPEWAVVRLRFGGVPAARILLSFGGDAEVMSPPEVRDDLAAVAAATVELYDRTLHHRTRV